MSSRPLHVLTIIDSLVPGGAERSLEALAPSYRDRGIRMDVAYLKPRPGIHESLRQAGCTLFDLSGTGGRLGWVRRARSLIRALSPDLVHTTLFESDVAGRIAARSVRVPVVTSLVNEAYGTNHVHSSGYDAYRVRACQGADAATSRLAVRFHANSQNVRDVMARRLGLSTSRIDVVPRGRSEAALGPWSRDRRQRTRQILGVHTDRLLVLAAARHESPKGLDILVRAFAQSRSPGAPMLVIAGRDGAATPAIANELRSAPTERIKLVGHRDDLADLMCAADLFVLPSLREGFPGVLLEAMALGCPIIATEIPGAREALGSNGAGTFVPTGNAAAMATAIDTLLADPGRRASQASAAARRFRDNFTIDRIADQMVSFYHRALADAART